MKLLVYLVISSVSIFIASYILPGIYVQNVVTVLVLAIVLGVLNAILKPILLLLTLPITIITLGLFIFVLNALMVLLAALLVPGFEVSGFFSALFFSIVVSIISWFLSLLLNKN